MNGMAAIDRDFLADKARFLDGLIAEVRAITGRVFGATTYRQLRRDAGPQVGIGGRPSAPTVQQAILCAQALARCCRRRVGHPSGRSGADPAGVRARSVKRSRRCMHRSGSARSGRRRVPHRIVMA